VLGKDKDKQFTLGNMIFYLDVYYQGLANGLTPTKNALPNKKITEDYFKAYFKGLLSNKAMVRVLANGYIHHITNLIVSKVEDHKDNDLQDVKIHNIKASFDFGNKLTIMAFLFHFGKEPTEYGFSYGDSLQFVLSFNGKDYSVKTLCND
jgi:hypothetical protein